jgi:hypothetical protein
MPGLRVPCSFCQRDFISDRGVKQHQCHCLYNPDALMYASGEYDPIIRNGRIIGRSSIRKNEIWFLELSAGIES